MPAHSASRLRGSSAVRPCTVDELAAILAAIAARLFLHLLAATWRGPGEEQSAAVPAAEAHTSSSPRRRGPSAFGYRVAVRSKCFATSEIAGPSNSTCTAKSLSAPCSVDLNCGAAESGTTM